MKDTIKRAECFAVFFLLLSVSAFAARNYRCPNKIPCSMTIEGGFEYFAHYNRIQTASTPPDSILGIGRFTYWIDPAGIMGVYGEGGFSIMKADSKQAAVGMKVAFLTVVPPGRRSVLGAVTLFGAIDGAYYKTNAAVPPESYKNKSFLLRYGGGIDFSIDETGLQIGVQMLLTKFSGNFFIAPSASFGVNF